MMVHRPLASQSICVWDGNFRLAGKRRLGLEKGKGELLEYLFVCLTEEKVMASGAERWEHFQHVADVGVRGLGPTLESAFAQAALAMTAVLAEPALIRPETRVVVSCAAPDLELLFVDWLNVLLYEMAVRKMLFSRFAVRLAGTTLVGEAWGEAVDVARHAPAVEIKGATYTALRVARLPEGLWLAQCVVDV